MEEIIEVICYSESPFTPQFNIGDKAATGEQKENRIFPQKRICNIKWWGEKGMRSGSVFLDFDYFLHLL